MTSSAFESRGKNQNWFCCELGISSHHLQGRKKKKTTKIDDHYTGSRRWYCRAPEARTMRNKMTLPPSLHPLDVMTSVREPNSLKYTFGFIRWRYYYFIIIFLISVSGTRWSTDDDSGVRMNSRETPTPTKYFNIRTPSWGWGGGGCNGFRCGIFHRIKMLMRWSRQGQGRRENNRDLPKALVRHIYIYYFICTYIYIYV